MAVSLTLSQFNGLRKQLVDYKGSDIKSHAETGDFTGVVTTKDVVLDYYYDATKQLLNLAVGKRLSLAAKIAPEQVIIAHATEALHTLAVTAPVEEVAPEAGVETAPADSQPDAVKITNDDIFKKAGE